MKMHPKSRLILLSVILLGALGLAACSNPKPIAVYITPTPALTDQPLPTPSGSTPGSAQINAQPTEHQITPLPTPLPPPPGVTWGPVVGSNNTPEPLHTPLPAEVSVRPCVATVTVLELPLYQSPNKSATIIRSAAEREKLVVNQITTDSAGNQWADTPEGWLTLKAGGVKTAQLNGLRSCEILLGHDPNTTLLGLHVLNDRSRDEVLALVQRMVDAGHPLGTLKGLNGTEDLLNEAKRISPQTVIVYRSILSPDGVGDCPADIREQPDPAATAQRWLAGLKPYWDQVNADYYELMSECPAPLNWIASFSIDAMKIANEQERCLLLFSFPGGNPDMQVFNDLLPAYQYAVEHPCQPGRTHGIALHAFSLQDDQLVSESDVWVALRHRILYQRLLLVLPEAANLPVYLTEVGIGGATFLPPCDTVVRDALQFTYELEEDPYVKGFHLWNVGSGEQWYDITPCLPALGDALIAYYSGS
jgi:hypothetical protein